MKFLQVLLFLTAGTTLWAQDATISGTITDASTGEALPAASIYNSATLRGTTSNVYGFYSLRQARGPLPLVVSYTGYQSFTADLNLRLDTVINIRLKPVIALDEVVVQGQGPIANLRSTQMSSIQLNPQKAAQIPMLLGETDLIKAFQLMPGVQGGSEGTSGFYVRGGGPDQNLILLDGVPVYNVNHLFGFMSVFNTDALRDVTLIKGGFPARYGGRLSSVLDIRMKEGNNQEFKGSASMGILSSKLTLEGPIIKDKTAFMFSGRRSYFDLLSYPIQMQNNKDLGPGESFWLGYFLQDFNLKVNHIFNDRNRLYLSLYTGKDKFYMRDKYKYEGGYYGPDGYQNDDVVSYSNYDKAGLEWGNTTGALRWNSILSRNIFANFTATLSNYQFKIFEDYKEERKSSNEQQNGSSSYYYEYYSRIRDYGFKADFDYLPSPNHYLRFGLHNTLHSFSPGVTVARDNMFGEQAQDTIFGNKDILANELMLYVEDDFHIGDRLKVNAGLHYSNFHVQGTHYHSLEPRASLRWMLSDQLAAKLSYAKMQQYLHLLANSSMGLPTDLWVPATKRIKPQKSTQVALGLSYTPNNSLEFSLESYYKKMTRLIDYAEGSSFFELDRGNWEDLVTVGEGESYGFELLAQKHKGRLSGWVGYTLSWTNRTFAEINFGETYPYRFDARHDLSIVSTFKISERTDVGATWVYRTGMPFTLEDESFYGTGSFFRTPDGVHTGTGEIGYFEKRNNYRMSDYHRLDVGFNFHKQKKRVYRTWSFGLYNAYARNNPFMVYTEDRWDGQGQTTQLKQLSIFNLIPYLRWSIQF